MVGHSQNFFQALDQSIFRFWLVVVGVRPPIAARVEAGRATAGSRHAHLGSQFDESCRASNTSPTNAFVGRDNARVWAPYLQKGYVLVGKDRFDRRGALIRDAIGGYGQVRPDTMKPQLRRPAYLVVIYIAEVAHDEAQNANFHFSPVDAILYLNHLQTCGRRTVGDVPGLF